MTLALQNLTDSSRILKLLDTQIPAIVGRSKRQELVSPMLPPRCTAIFSFLQNIHVDFIRLFKTGKEGVTHVLVD